MGKMKVQTISLTLMILPVLVCVPVHGKEHCIVFYDIEVIVNAPKGSRVTQNTHYEEGSFSVINCPSDTAYYTICRGGNINFEMPRDTIVTSKSNILGKVRITRGYRIFRGQKKYFRIERYPQGLELIYENVPEEKKDEYESYFNNIIVRPHAVEDDETSNDAQ